MSKYKSHIFFFGLLLILSAVFYFVGELILPFIVGLIAAYILNPLVKKIQKYIPNRKWAVSCLLFLLFIFSTGTLFFFGNQIIHDFKRLNKAFVKFADNNSEEIDETAQVVKSYIEKIYPQKEIDEQLNFEEQKDSLMPDSETIKESVANVVSFFGSSEADEEKEKKGYNWFFIFFSAIAYFVYILYTYPYLSVVVMLIVPAVIIYMPIDFNAYRDIDKYFIDSYNASNFHDLNYALGYILGITGKEINYLIFSEIGIKIQVFIAFAYTYHYLNWFSKTTVIGWHKVISKKRLILLLAIWVVSVGFYFYNYYMGFLFLLFLSYLHVLMEFPLNWVSIKEIGKKIVGK